MVRDYIKENKERKKAIEAEERFLRKEVIGQGGEIPTTYENIQSNMEDAIENERQGEQKD